MESVAQKPTQRLTSLLLTSPRIAPTIKRYYLSTQSSQSTTMNLSIPSVTFLELITDNLIISNNIKKNEITIRTNNPQISKENSSILHVLAFPCEYLFQIYKVTNFTMGICFSQGGILLLNPSLTIKSKLSMSSSNHRLTINSIIYP